jgi:hypothetical protein
MMSEGPPDGYVTSAEACKRLGISDRTLRRRVQAGTVEGEYVARPQGSVLYVKLPAEAAMQTAQAADAVIDQENGQAASDAAQTATAPTEPPALTMRSLDILDALLRANSDTMERQAERIDQYGELLRQEMERRVRAEERAIAADRRADQAERERDALRARRWWRFWE